MQEPPIDPPYDLTRLSDRELAMLDYLTSRAAGLAAEKPKRKRHSARAIRAIDLAERIDRLAAPRREPRAKVGNSTRTKLWQYGRLFVNWSSRSPRSRKYSRKTFMRRWRHDDISNARPMKRPRKRRPRPCLNCRFRYPKPLPNAPFSTHNPPGLRAKTHTATCSSITGRAIPT